MGQQSMFMIKYDTCCATSIRVTAPYSKCFNDTCNPYHVTATILCSVKESIMVYKMVYKNTEDKIFLEDC